ncbi:MAG: phosphoribosylformylglycinamidine cyclo-ligase [Bdellovibrionaceae bacterium]|nr:phosphoribosylformylglycinamidine cyclo-ligase [Pseudobdellovibrionaceae bacterium]
MAIDYKKAGVDIEKGDALVSWLQSDTRPSPHQDKIVSGIGGFAALFRADFKKYKKPCLVSATDGVGTKVMVATQFKNYNGIGQDLVGMCVNDLICCGAEPLFFLDYFASGKLDLDVAQTFLKGLKEACHESGCALIGGETAEMPGVYHNNDFDCAGFAVGVVDEADMWGEHKVCVGDKIYAFPSSGFHSNGYSLLRKVFAEDLVDWQERLLIPTRLYPSLIKGLSSEINVHALAHITGGGLDNILRVIPDGMAVQLNTWKVPDVFLEVKRRAEMSWESLLTTLNCGIGMVLIASPEDEENLKKYCQKQNQEYWSLGDVISSSNKSWHLDFSTMDGV